MDYTAATLADWLKISPDSDPDNLAMIVAAVRSYVDGLPDQCVDKVPDPADPTGATLVWADSVHLAARMLGSRLYRRRNSPSGVEAFGADGATYVARYDPDVARLLHLDRFAQPQVG